MYTLFDLNRTLLVMQAPAPITLQKQIVETRSRYLVFTSAGPNANIETWLGSDRNWDLWLCNYSDIRHSHYADADYYHERPGAKFPNLHFACKQWPEIFDAYDAVLVIDDDVIISSADINRLFALREQYDLWILQPSFSPKGKVSHRITGARALRQLTYTNFVEVCAPLFREDKLSEFLKQYDPQLFGWGVDFWWGNVFKSESNRLAVIHDVVCINPLDSHKSGVRDIDVLQSQVTREATWKTIQKKYNLFEYGFCEYQTVWKPFSFQTILSGLKIFLTRKYYRIRKNRI